MEIIYSGTSTTSNRVFKYEFNKKIHKTTRIPGVLHKNMETLLENQK